MQVQQLWIGTLVGLLASCVSTPSGPPEEVAPRIVAALEAGQKAEAEELFEACASDGDASELLYPLLYEEARVRYQKGESGPSARILGFMSGRYPRALAVREGLVYALFLERARSAVPAPELVQELDAAVTELRKAASVPPPWLDLVEAQLAIDRGETAAAREAFASFEKGWDGGPAELTVYVEDIDRYLDSNP